MWCNTYSPKVEAINIVKIYIATWHSNESFLRNVDNIVSSGHISFIALAQFKQTKHKFDFLKMKKELVGRNILKSGVIEFQKDQSDHSSYKTDKCNGFFLSMHN